MTTRPAPTRDGLSDIDVHYVVGFLYVITRREDTIVLGERILDATTGTERDVDIVVSGTWGVLGVEVKDKGRALDVGIVEGICQKFADMPDITERAIVSSSDYTEPARKKAAAHGVRCLRFVRGAIPPTFEGTDLSSAQSITLRHARWRSPPTVVVITTKGETLRGLPRSASLTAPGSKGGGPQTLGEMIDRVPDKLVGPSGPADFNAEIDYTLAIKTRRGPRDVAAIRFTGQVVVSFSESPLRSSCYLADEAGTALAAVVIFDNGGGLVGVAATPERKLSIIPIPAELRGRRPHRAPLGRR